ncbi:regulator of nonsense transcripts 3B [Malaya genurostris]|uniref:regulator of nonsense transcripts 3B n=1 Tax=Malaya genurostris TaxID=325434 RepID=UPI0026F3E88F|nr:regulator of nonsense transcripts 3B [Malaya genurostris]
MVESQQKFPEIMSTTGAGGTNSSVSGSAPEGSKSKVKTDKKEAGGGKRNKKSKKDVPKPLTKVVIRRLPPSMDEETFRKQIDPIPDHEDFYFVSGDWSLGKNASSRAYISFSKAEDIFLFKDKFDGYIFVDSKGVEFPAVVEYAPFQELPRNRSRKKDAKCGTIEVDTHFKAFQEALELEEKESTGKSKSKLEYSYQIKDEKKITSTPLLEFIAQKRLEKREEKRRKMEEKKKQRKEERQKKSQVGKPITEAIKEEIGKEDDIVVRTVPSRLDPNQIKKDSGKRMNEKIDFGKDPKDKDKKQRNKKEKEKERVKQEKDDVVGGQEKALSRKQERDRQRKEKDKARKLEEKDRKPTGESSNREKEVPPKVVEVLEVPKVVTADVPRKEVKKYSERRKETRARAETRLAELEERSDVQTPITSEHFKSIAVIPKIDIKKSVLTPHVAPFIPKEKSTIILGESSGALPPAFPQKSSTAMAVASQPTEESLATKELTPAPDTAAADSSSSERKPDIDEKLKEAREARKIRNKNRPSIAIYQPRKRMIPETAVDDDKMKDKSDSDRSSDKSVKPKPATEKDKRHKLTKKSSDKERPKDRRCRRKNSSDLEGDRDRKEPSRKNSREEPAPPAEPAPITASEEKSAGQSVSEAVEALDGIDLNS